MKPEEIVDRMSQLVNESVEDGHHVADLADLALGVALRCYSAAGYSPEDVRALLLARLRSVVRGGRWDVPS